jgi:hypothetical protein
LTRAAARGYNEKNERLAGGYVPERNAAMSWGAYAILFIFGAFIVLLIINPNMSCFGRRVKSPFYPLTRKSRARKKMTDYKFNLVEESGEKDGPAAGKRADEKTVRKTDKKTDDYGFRLD